MKKTYEAPTAEKMEFKYRDQVVVASSTYCEMVSVLIADPTNPCHQEMEYNN